MKELKVGVLQQHNTSDIADNKRRLAEGVRETWPRTRVQRCTFHAFSQVWLPTVPNSWYFRNSTTHSTSVR